MLLPILFPCAEYTFFTSAECVLRAGEGAASLRLAARVWHHAAVRHDALLSAPAGWL